MDGINYKIYIGYDSTEEIAAEVCKFSIESRSRFKTQFLNSSEIKGYARCIQEPQSTDFTFSRFWVPYLSNYTGYSIFVDCDFLFLHDIDELFSIARLNDTAVSVVKLPEYVPRSSVKMNNVPQHRSYRKNWASLMVFDNSKCRNLTPDYLINITPGIKLHHFEWVSDSEIGSIPIEWNVLDEYDFETIPKAIHYTDGGPWFENHQNTYYSHMWKEELKKWKS